MLEDRWSRDGIRRLPNRNSPTNWSVFGKDLLAPLSVARPLEAARVQSVLQENATPSRVV
jgi:hypothetical protein